MARVRALVADLADGVAHCIGDGADLAQLMPGKMLRTRLASRLAAQGLPDLGPSALARVCAATELVHTASLCHDDVVDNTLIRRALPTLWRATTPSGAVLIGDLLLCEATGLLLQTAGGRYVKSFVAKVREMCAAEAEQEIRWRGRCPDESTCLRLARQKTGPLFAFVARACAGDDGRLAAALEEAGYCLGAAYQLADDLIDVLGREDVAGKTLGTDRERGKFTLAHASEDGPDVVRRHVSALCNAALEGLDSWPQARGALRRFFVSDLGPVFRRHGQHLDLSLGSVA